MPLRLSKIVVRYLSAQAEQRFTARQVAQWILDNYAADCQEKKANSIFLKTDADLVQQLVAEISSLRPALQKRFPQIKTTEGHPRRYYWTAKSDQAEAIDAISADVGDEPLRRARRRQASR